MISNPLKKICKKLNVIDLLGTVCTEKSYEEWTDDFIEWLKSRNEQIFMSNNKINNINSKLLDSVTPSILRNKIEEYIDFGIERTQ